MLTPEQFKRACGNLLGIVNSQTAISTKADLGDKSALSSLNDAGRQLNDDTLRVLVMGKFSSGKSTFLNALMGETFLPAKPTPTTAVIGEIVYADNPEAVLYPKKGYSGGEKPFNIRVEELEKYIVIDHSNSNSDEAKKPNPFKKIVIKYPLSVCKHGIMFVDSPGLDDPTCHDAITQEYLPNADAIVYCMNSSQAFSAADKTEIERLVALGYKSIIFVLTYFDVLQSNDDIMGTHEAENTRRHYTEILSKYTDLGKSGIFFVGSLPALKAKRTGNQRLLDESNFPPLESRLEEILFNEKGRMKLLKALYSTRRVNRITGQQLTALIEIANSDKKGLSERIHIAQNNLNQAREKANEIYNSFKISSNNLIQGSKDRGWSFFLNTIIPNIDKWADSFVPSSDEQSISMWHPKRTGTAFAEACVKHVQGQIETKMAEWCDKDLVKGYIQPQLEVLTQQQDASLAEFENELEKVRASLNLSLNVGDISDPHTPGKANRILSAIAGALLNPASLVVGGAFGWQGLVSSLVTTLVSGIVLSIIGLFTPVGWPAVIIALIVSAIISGKYVGHNIEEKIKKDIAEKMHQEMSNQQETIVSNIENTVAEIVNKIQIAVEDGLYAPVKQFEKILNEAQNSIKAEDSIIQARVSLFTKLRQDNAKLADDMDKFSQDLSV